MIWLRAQIDKSQSTERCKSPLTITHVALGMVSRAEALTSVALIVFLARAKGAFDDQSRINCKQSFDDKVSGDYPEDDKLR